MCNSRWCRYGELVHSQPHQQQSPSWTVAGTPYPGQASLVTDTLMCLFLNLALTLPTLTLVSPTGLLLASLHSLRKWVLRCWVFPLSGSLSSTFSAQTLSSNSLSKWISFSFLPQVPKGIPHLILVPRLKAKVKPIKNRGMSTFIMFICLLNFLFIYMKNEKKHLGNQSYLRRLGVQKQVELRRKRNTYPIKNYSEEMNSARL